MTSHLQHFTIDVDVIFLTCNYDNFISMIAITTTFLTKPIYMHLTRTSMPYICIYFPFAHTQPMYLAQTTCPLTQWTQFDEGDLDELPNDEDMVVLVDRI